MRVVVGASSTVFAEGTAAALEAAGVGIAQPLAGPGWPVRLASLIRRERIAAAVLRHEVSFPDETFAELVAHGTAPYALIDVAEPAIARRCLAAGAAGVFVAAQPIDELASALVDAIAGVTRLSPAAHVALAAPVSAPSGIGSAAGGSASRLASLTPAERAVLHGLALGRGARVIAADRGVSIHTVRAQVRAVLRKLGVNSQIAAVALLAAEAEQVTSSLARPQGLEPRTS